MKRRPLETYYTPEPMSGCWLWTGALDGKGYGIVCRPRIRGMTQLHHFAHRVMYEKFRGPIPEGLTLDHLCANRQCVSPWHLEPVTREMNIMRGMGAAAQNARKMRCPRGHEFTAGQRVAHGRPVQWRICRECQAEAVRRYKRRLRITAGWT